MLEGWTPESVWHLDLPWRRVDEVVPIAPRGRPDSVVFLGRLAAEKGLHVLLKAWAGVATHHPRVRLRIIGDGGARHALTRRRTAMQLPRVDFLGTLDKAQIERELGRAIVTAHPAQWPENSPYSVRESLMAGVPAIVSAVGGLPEMVDSTTGRIVPHNDHVAWTDTLNQILSGDLFNAQQLRATVMSRAMTDTEHLDRLEAAYLARVKV